MHKCTLKVCEQPYIPHRLEMADQYVLVLSAGYLFFFWKGVVSHLLFEACRKITAQLQTAVAGGREQGSRMHREMQVKVGPGIRNAAGLHVCVWQMDDETEGKTWYLRVCLHYDWDTVGGLQGSSQKKTCQLLKASTHRAAHSNRVISSSDDFWYVVFQPRFTAPRSSQSPRLQKDQCWEHILLQQRLGACSQRWKRSLWI